MMIRCIVHELECGKALTSDGAIAVSPGCNRYPGGNLEQSLRRGRV
jgi:hypothetical protein